MGSKTMPMDSRRERAERRLAAILAADVAGYSRLMGADEEGTLAALKAIRRELGDPNIAEHRGRIVKTTGDGLLVEFPSVVDAVRCAVEVQRAMAERNAVVPAERRIEFRIGINLGDIIIEEDDIYRRRRQCRRPARRPWPSRAASAFSRVVHDQVRDKLDLAFDDHGRAAGQEHRPAGAVFRVRLDRGPARREPPVRCRLPDKPSLAVLPFQNMCGDPEQEYFADGMVEEITTAIARFPLAVRDRPQFELHLQGQGGRCEAGGARTGRALRARRLGRKAGNRVRITGQLIDAATGAHLWADRFDGASTTSSTCRTSRIACRRRHRAEAAPHRNRPRQPQADREPRRLRPLSARAGADVQKNRGGHCRGDPAGSPRPRTRSAFAPAMARIASSRSIQMLRHWIPASGAEVEEGIRWRGRRSPPPGIIRRC